MIRTSRHGVGYYISPLLEALGVPHAFSTRVGGVSAGPFASLNLGNPNGCPLQDNAANIAENYRRLMIAIGCTARRREWLHQVHGCAVWEAAAATPIDTGNDKGDALVTRDGGRVLSMRVADCTPVLLASSDGTAVAAVHAGWRGVVGGVVAAAAARLEQCAGESAGAFTAAIGPCIGYDAFEVGEEVIEQFAALDRRLGNHRRGPAAPQVHAGLPPDDPGTPRAGSAAQERTHAREDAAEGLPLFRRVGQGKGRVDLRGAIFRQLRAAGIPDARIDQSDRCTHRDADEFFSHRRERGVTGRMAALVGPRA